MVQYGVHLATAFKSHLTVLTVADIRIFEWASAIGTDGFIPIVPSGIYKQESRKILEEKCDKVLDKCRSLLHGKNIAYELLKRIGSPVDAILDMSLLSDLIIMGKRGEYERWDNRSLGATVESISRYIKKPLIVCNDRFKEIDKILVGFDESEHAYKALQYVGHIAEALEAELTVIAVTDDKELGKHDLKKAGNYLGNYQIDLKSEIIGGDPDKKICDFAFSNQHDLIAIGAFGRLRIKETILGSTTEHILRRAHSPVLLAK